MNNLNETAILQAVSGSCKTMVDNTLRITFDFEPRQAATAFKMFGERGTPAAIALITKEASLSELPKTEAEEKEVHEKPAEAKIHRLGKGQWGDYAASLYKSGFFYGEKVLVALGSDKTYRKWIQKQPSAYSGDFSEWVDGEGRSIAAHVRRSGEAGTGYKPPYSCIPLTDKEHQWQHQHGESYLVDFDWDKAKNDYLIKWAVSVLYEMFNVDSLTKLNPIDLNYWCEVNELMVYLPKKYKEYRRGAA